jgi:two-component system heavy metal sensor histidine kinase CusS
MAVLLMVGLLIGTLVEAHFEELDLIELNSKLELVRYTFAKVRTPSDMAVLHQNLADALVGDPGLSVAVVGSDRRLLFQSAGAVFPAALLEYQALEDLSRHTRPVIWARCQAYRGIAAGAKSPESPTARGNGVVAVNIEHHRMFMDAFKKRLWLAIAASIALTALLGWIAARRGLAPVREMAHVAQGISANRLGDRLPPESVPTELVDLAIAFNDMLARLEGSFRRLSDFSSDLAHELRTPISNLMTQTPGGGFEVDEQQINIGQCCTRTWKRPYERVVARMITID